MTIPQMLYDGNDVKSIWQAGEGFRVGDKFDGRTIARMKLYGEAGQGGWVPWIAALDEAGNVIARFNPALFDTIVHMPETEAA